MCQGSFRPTSPLPRDPTTPKNYLWQGKSSSQRTLDRLHAVQDTALLALSRFMHFYPFRRCIRGACACLCWPGLGLTASSSSTPEACPVCQSEWVGREIGQKLSLSP